ncbi:tyrosine-type recombinase/integrase [Enemella evansiae]|uniref:hypothetical protein n=1 Tax=Enemella evansiae TaxID=2016499 RepID=UPI0011815E7A|nr:hypothetical protein [Enemella evansiae]
MSGRAPQGFGSFKRTPKGFEAWISLGTGPDGKRVRRHLVAPTQDELMDKIAKLRERAQIGSVLDDKLTVGAWLRHWLGVVEKRDIAPATFEKYRWAVEKHLVPALGNVTLIELTTERCTSSALTLNSYSVTADSLPAQSTALIWNRTGEAAPTA